MIQPVFMLELNHKIIPGVITIGKYDGNFACLTAATTADKVIIHNPHKNSSLNTGRIQWSESHKEVAILNLSQSITCLEAGQLNPQKERDILLIGSPTHLLAYDIQDNTDLFYKDIPNGVSKIIVGKYGKLNQALAIIGGKCSIHALDHHGNEIFWNVVGDDVKSLMLMDYDKDGSNELIVGCSDYIIKIFKEDHIFAEISETEMVIGLTLMQEARFGYSLSNGTVGIYEEGIRLWRVKSKNTPVDIHCYDLLGNGNSQLITGWTNGKIDCRDVKSGELLFKDNMGHSVAGIVEGDYRESGKTDLICVSVEGEVRGYTTAPDRNVNLNAKMDQEAIRDLFSRKQALLLELKHYENNTKFNEQYDKNSDTKPSIPNTMGVIPANTRLQIGLATNHDSKDKNAHIEVSVSTNNYTIIKVVIIFAEGIFDGETHVEHPDTNNLSNTMNIALYPPRDVPIDIHIKAFVGFTDSQQFHVFELTRQLPRFSMYCIPDPETIAAGEIGQTLKIPASYVTFRITERMQRICIWINQNFLLSNEVEVDSENSQELHILLNCLRDNSYLLMDFEMNGDVKFSTSNMELAGDLIQSLGVFLNLENLTSKSNFPEDELHLYELVNSLDDIQEVRMRLDTDAAEQMQNIKHLITIAEEKRSHDLSEMLACYNEIMDINKDLMQGNMIRLTNHQTGSTALKTINGIIQRASRLRLGKYAMEMVNHCRTAIKYKNVEGLLRVIKTGEL